MTFYNNFGSILVLGVRKNQIKNIKNMSEFVNKSDIVAEKIARRKEVTKEIKEMRSFLFQRALNEMKLQA